MYFERERCTFQPPVYLVQELRRLRLRWSWNEVSGLRRWNEQPHGYQMWRRPKQWHGRNRQSVLSDGRIRASPAQNLRISAAVLEINALRFEDLMKQGTKLTCDSCRLLEHDIDFCRVPSAVVAVQIIWTFTSCTNGWYSAIS